MSKSSKLMSALCASMFALAVGSAAQAQDAKCQDAMAKSSRNVGNQEQKKNRKCVKDGSGDVSGCVNTPSPKATDKATKVFELFDAGGKCETVPAVGVNNAGTPAGDTAVDAVIDSSGDILRGVFGDPVDGIVAGDKCSDAIVKRAGKAFDSGLKGYRGCVKPGVASQGAVDACVAAGVNDAKAAKFLDEKLPNDILKKCETFPIPGTEDGTCAACTDGPTCAACVDAITRCEICEAANAIGNGGANCDTLDDGLANASCGGAPPPCPIAQGRYTLTQSSGGQLQVASIDGGTPGGFPFPTGGTVVQDVVAASPPSCVHDTVIPATGGFSAPIFCIPGLNFSVQVTQNGCGVGQIDSNGGSDYTIVEVGDTSDSSATCSQPHTGCPPGPAVNGADASVRVDITVGNGAADTCGGGGTANAIAIIPVMTQTWLADDFSCPDSDGVFDGADTDILLIDQNLDFTTDVSSSSWTDIDGDGCSIAGAGPAAGFSRTGVCLDIGAQTVTTVATGTIGSDGSPLFDLTFATRLPNTISGPAAFGGASCGVPPVVNFSGLATRCIP
jgi:hypothetical protein